MITHQKLLEVVHYAPETGVFTWLQNTSQRKRVGNIVGSVHRMGYLEASIFQQRFLLHRLAWFYVHGEMPRGVIDHINGNKQDNRIVNLRDVTQVENGLNRHRANKNSVTGVRGVCFHKLSGKYMARFGDRYLGLFTDMLAAKSAVDNEMAKTI